MNISNFTNFSTYPIQSGTFPVSGTAVHPEPYALRIVSLLLFSVIILASLIGNSLVLKAVIELPIQHKPFTYHLVANLAGAEIVSSICQPFIMTYQEMYSWMFGEFACTLLIPLQVLAVIVVTGDMAAIAVYRYTRIVTSREKVSGLMGAVIIGGTWLAALVISLPLFVTQMFVELPSGHKLCYSKFSGDDTYTIIRFTLCFLLPYLLMIWSYGAVALKLKRHIRRNVEETSEITISMLSRGSSDERRAVLHLHYGAHTREVPLEVTDRNAAMPATKSSAELDVLRMIYVIIISFVVCYIPYQILFLWEFSTAESNRWQFRYQAMVRKYFYILTCLPSAIHPLCYGTMNRFFAQAFSKIVMCRR